MRLIPLYYLFTILHLLVFGAGERYWLGTLSEVSWVNILANLLFLHGLHPYFINAINVNWFMADIAIFYIIAPFLFKLVNSLEKSCIALLVVVTSGFCLKSVVINWNIIEVQSIWNDYVNIISFPAEFPIILLGIVVYYLYKKVIKEDLVKYKLCFSLSCLLFILISLYSLFLRKDYFLIYNNIFSFGIIFAIVFFSQLLYPIKLIKNGSFSLFGKHSYGIYLSHIFIISIVERFNIVGDNSSIFIRVIGFIIVTLGALMVSVVAEELIEKNVIRLLKKV